MEVRTPETSDIILINFLIITGFYVCIVYVFATYILKFCISIRRMNLLNSIQETVGNTSVVFKFLEFFERMIALRNIWKLASTLNYFKILQPVCFNLFLHGNFLQCICIRYLL